MQNICIISLFVALIVPHYVKLITEITLFWSVRQVDVFGAVESGL